MSDRRNGWISTVPHKYDIINIFIEEVGTAASFHVSIQPDTSIDIYNFKVIHAVDDGGILFKWGEAACIILN